MNSKVLSLLLIPAAALALAGCAKIAAVTARDPSYTPAAVANTSLSAADGAIAEALREKQLDPLAALSRLLGAAELASAQLRNNPSDKAARDTYNFAVARVVGVIQQAKLDPWTQPLRVPSAGGDFLLSNKPDPRPQWNPALYDFVPADQFDVKGTYVTEHMRKEGVGAPVVAIGRSVNEQARETFSLPKVFYGVTAVLHFKDRKALLAFEDPLATENISLEGQSFPMAADYTVPIAVLLASADTRKAGLPRLLRPGEHAETARIVRFQPYDPNKTVVLVVHGLASAPPTWTPLINHLRSDEKIRRNYQFWFYTYPSGYPYPSSAAILRRELDAVHRQFPLRKKMVVIGHSMGGCISRLLITDTRDELWQLIFNKTPGETTFSPEARKLFTEALIFRHRPEIGRVIFVSAPLRGSDLASNWLGRIGSGLVKMPTLLREAGDEALRQDTFREGELKLDRIPNSVDTLAPNNRFVRAINTLPLARGIPYHVISGDRGKGGNKDQTKPVMSDGVVPYWSSHMEGAVSELVVPSSHAAHQHPQAIAEVERILSQYANRN